ncbi:hypothetical protein EDD11_008425 [Mortierella claussenii]|nr:hypothetical protein EDD11_008425 [Mortierella claussenii]
MSIFKALDIMCSLRHFAGMAGGIVKMSGLIWMNFSEFFGDGGLKNIKSNVAEVYECVKSGLDDVPVLIEEGRGIL